VIRGTLRLGPLPPGRTDPIQRKEDLMRVMFVTWLTLIAAGVIFFAVVGLTHH
jgi:hypothetical protein